MANKNLIRRMRQLLTLVLVLAMTMSFATMTAMAGEESVGIEKATVNITKVWEKDEEGNRPGSVTVKVGENEVNLTAGDGWKASVDVDVFNDDGTTKTYDISEVVVENYETSIDPAELKLKGFVLVGELDVVRECDTQTKYLAGKNVAVFKKGNDFVVWTEQKLSAGAKAVLVDLIESSGNGDIKDLGNPDFVCGYGPFSELGDNVTISMDGTIYFERKSTWSWFYRGLFALEQSEYVVTVTNTYKGTPIEKNGTDVTFTKTVLSTNGAEIPYGENGLKFNFQLLNEDGTTWGNESAVVTTNSKNPTVTFENVPNGTYTLTETAVEGWESSIPEKGITVVVNDGKVTFDSAGTLTVTNTYKGTPTTPPGENGNGGGSIGGGGTVTPPPDQNLEIPETPVEPETPAEPAEPVKPLPDDKHIETEVPKTGDVGTDALTLNLLLLSISALAGTAFYLRRKTSGR